MKIVKVCLVLGLFLSLVGCSSSEAVNPDETEKETVEYNKDDFHYIEDLKTISVDMFSYNGFTDADHVFRKLSFNESLRFFDEKGTGLLFYGYPTCAVCTQVVPVLNVAAKESGLTVNYVDLNSETIADDKLEYFESTVEDHLFLEEDGTRSFRVPFVLVVINGEVISSHIGHLGSEGPTLNEAEKKELTEYFEEMFIPLM